MKIPEVELKIQNRKDIGLLDFIECVRQIINLGRYQLRVVTTEPTWTGDDGESVFYYSGETRRYYVYFNGGWNYIQWTGIGSGVDTTRILDADGDTQVQTEESSDEDIIRFDAAGTEIATADSDQFAVNSGIKLGLEGNNGDTYLKYNSATGYTECYTNGVKRIEY